MGIDARTKPMRKEKAPPLRLKERPRPLSLHSLDIHTAMERILGVVTMNTPDQEEASPLAQERRSPEEEG